ncbi:uncharacterized protein ACIBXB_021591 [Morphnus guianensis]
MPALPWAGVMPCRAEVRLQSWLILLSWLLVYHFSLLKNPLQSKNAAVAHAVLASRSVGQSKVTGLVPGFPLWEGEICAGMPPNSFLQLFSPCSLPLVHPNSSALALLDTTEAVFDFIQRSRRMIVVLSPDYLTEKSISLLEFKLGIMCQNAIATKLIVVEYRPLQCTHPSILQLKESVSFVTWKGEKSKRSGSQFWKALRLALPLRSLSAGTGWNESCSSQSDISLDPVQRRRSQLKGQLSPRGTAAGTLVPGGTAPAPESKAKHRAKHFLTCQCCGTYCNGGSRLKRKHRAGAEPRWDAHLCKLGSGRPAAQGVQGRSRPEPPPAQAPTLALCHYSDLSNNNDFYVL